MNSKDGTTSGLARAGESVREGLAPKRLMSSLTAGLVLGVINISVATSFAALIFSGELAPFMAGGIAYTLFGAVVLGVVVAMTSSLPGMIAVPQESPAVILALVAAAIRSRMPAASPPAEIFITVVAAIALTSVLTGGFFIALGRFKLGRLIRYVPYPVIGGCLAGTGWLLVQGGFDVMIGRGVGWSDLASLFAGPIWVRWLPGFALAALMLAFMRRSRHLELLPIVILAAVGLFHLGVRAAGLTMAEAGRMGLLLGPFPHAVHWQPLLGAGLADVHWSALSGQIGSLGAILILSVISLLLNTSGLELTVRRDIDLNRELQASGLANVVAGLGGGTVGYPALTDTTLGHRLGANSRLASLISAALCAAVLFFGTALLSNFPRAVVGGLLLFLGFAFLIEWVWDAWFRLPRSDYGVMLLILAAVATIGFMPGVAVGLVATVILFVVKYSRVNVIHHELSGAHFHSRVDRNVRHRWLLTDKGDTLWILKLQGFLFFGTAHLLLDRLRERAARAPGRPLSYVVLDFHRVSGLDSSALFGFLRMKQLAEAQGFTLVLAHLPPGVRRRLERIETSLSAEGMPALRIFEELDLAMEWCEEEILAAAGITTAEAPPSLPSLLEAGFPSAQLVERLMGYLERRAVGEGEALIRQGDPPDALFFIEAGQVNVMLEKPDSLPLRLRRMGSGTVVGEVGMYMRCQRTASVIAETPTVAYRLSTAALRRMEQADPETAAAFHQYMARMLADRLAETDRTLEALMD